MQPERERRGYELSEEDRIIKNVDFLRAGFLQKVGRASELTIGRTAEVPGMIQEHQIFSIDMLTGMIFWPGDIKRIYGLYEAQEKDMTTLDYTYAKPNPDKKQSINLPKDYKVLPLFLYVQMRDLSTEAIDVIQRTKQELFKPVLIEVEKALKNENDSKNMILIAEIKNRILTNLKS